MSRVEMCWMVTSKISIILMLILDGICFGIFAAPYIKKKKGAAAVSLIYIAVMLVLYLIPIQISNFFAYLTGAVAAFIVMYAVDRQNAYQKIFLAVTFFSIRRLTAEMENLINDSITKAVIFKETMADWVWLQYGVYVATRILDILLCMVFIAGAIWLINRSYIYKRNKMSGKELIMLAIPSLVGVTGYEALQCDTYGILSFLHYLICIIVIPAMIVMFQNWKRTQEEKQGQELVLNQVNDIKRHIGEVEKLYSDIRSLRHDMGNHIQTLEHLVSLHNTDDAAEYLEHLKGKWDDISPEIKTGSPVADVILMEKSREAKEKNISFNCDFHYPENTKLNAFDLSVIMNNALNNCMENVSGNNPYISISSFRKDSIFMITIKNSFEGQLELEEGNLPQTTKPGKEHGIGLNNILRVAKMYMGDIAFEQRGGEVTLSIMLQVE